MPWNKTLFSALTLSLLLGASATCAATKAPVVKEVEDRGEIDQIKCDGMDEADVHVGDTLNFYVSFAVGKNEKVKVDGVRYWFWSDVDYNRGDPGIAFKATKEIMDSDGIIHYEGWSTNTPCGIRPVMTINLSTLLRLYGKNAVQLK